MKYGLFKYETENIGDEIQSIAARRFLPSVDAYIDRDRLGEYCPDEETKIITNGWFMHAPYQWPPKSGKVIPLTVSMYIDQADSKVLDTFFSDTSIKYLNDHGPVGARDLSTLELLQKHGVESYFSGCMTLTLQRDPSIPKGVFVLAVDVPQSVVEMVQSHTGRSVIHASPYFDANMSQDDRFQLAEYFLYLYQSAAAGISTRLHAMLPALALETPVFLVKDRSKYDEKRYAGLAELVNSATDEEYLNDYSLFDVDAPKKNPESYLKIRERLIEKAANFTGFDSDSSFRTVVFSHIADNESYIRLFTRGFHSLNRELLLEGDKKWLQEQCDDLRRIRQHLDEEVQDAQKKQNDLSLQNDILRKRIEVMENRIEVMEKSSSWRIGRTITAPGRKLKNMIRGN